MSEGDRRIIGNSPLDETIGRLLERTEQIMRQHSEFERTLDAFNRTLTEMRDTMSEMRATVRQLNEARPRHDDFEERLGKLEGELAGMKADVASWRKVKDKAVGWGAIIVLLALAGGGSGFALLKAALSTGAP